MTREWETVIRENFARVRVQIEEARLRSPYRQAPILVAATKTVPAEMINFASECLDLRIIGENRVQELLEKYDSLERDRIDIHFIGHLQTNKVKDIIDKVSMIHSVDSLKLAREIDRRAREAGRIPDVLAEINIGSEENKSGVLPGAAREFARALCEFPSINLRGFMTIAPNCEKKEDYNKYFKETYDIFIDFFGKKTHNIVEPVLSMGMSDSFACAIEQGANMIRIGSALFGRRKYTFE